MTRELYGNLHCGSVPPPLPDEGGHVLNSYGQRCTAEVDRFGNIWLTPVEKQLELDHVGHTYLRLTHAWVERFRTLTKQKSYKNFDDMKKDDKEIADLDATIEVIRKKFPESMKIVDEMYPGDKATKSDSKTKPTEGR